jgi:glycosyltransferase involved in cell wall biosynthesis
MVTTSFLMAVHNGEAGLAASIESVLSQSDPDLELVIVDDGSTDGTADLLAAQRDPRLRVIRQSNTGLTRALIRAANEARGVYLARQDCGDLSMPHRLARQRALLDGDPGLAFVSCWTEFVGPEYEPLYVVRGSGRASIAQSIIDLSRPLGVTDGPTAHGSVIMRRDAYEAAGGYRPAFYFGQDWDLWYRLAKIGTFQIVPEILYRYHMTLGGISLESRDAQSQFARLSELAMRTREAGQSDTEILRQAEGVARTKGSGWRARGLYFIGEALRRNGDPRARRYLREAVMARPLSARAWIRYVQSWTLR